METRALTPDPGSIKPKTVPLTPDPGSVKPRQPNLAQNAVNAVPWKVNTPNGHEPALQALLERPGQIIPAGLRHGPGAAWNALLHGVPQAQYEQDVRAIAGLPPTGRGTELFFNEMALDPTTYFGLSKTGDKLVTAGAEHLIPMIMGAAKKAAEKAPLGAPTDFVNWAARMGGRVHDFFTPGGQPVAHATRKLVEKYGAEGTRQSQRMQSAAAGARGMGDAFTATLRDLQSKALHGLSPDEEREVYKAIHFGTIAQLDLKLASRAKQLQTIDRSIPWIFGTKTLRTHLEGLGFQLPRQLQFFDTGGYGIVNKGDFMEHHVPMSHEFVAPPSALGSRPGARAVHDIRNRFFIKRQHDVDPAVFDDPAGIRETWGRSFGAAGKQYTGAQMRTNLYETFGQNKGTLGALQSAPSRAERASATAVFRRSVPGYVRRAYGAEKPQELTPEGELMQTLEHAGNLGKSTLFFTPFPHQRNIALLSALAKPGAIPGAIKNYAKMGLGFASPATKARVLGDALKAGATPMANVEQRGLIDLLNNKGGAPGKLLAKLYAESGKALWTWDEASKKALYDHALHTFGGDKGRAAAYVRRVLVDYSQTSKAQDVARLIFPFASWRTQMPKAVAESIARHPEYAIALDRLTHGAITGAPFTVGGQQMQSSNPLAEAGELIPPTTSKYGESALSLTAKALIDAAVAAHQAAGGHKPNVPYKHLESQIPVYGQLMDLLGKNAYGDTSADALRFLLTGVHKYKPPAGRSHRPPMPAR